MNIKKIIRPESVAVVGASEKKGFGHWSALQLLKSGNKVRVYFVHPKREEVLGVKCYKKLADLPEVVDCIVLATPRSVTNDLLREAGELGIGGAMVYASGYSEEHTEEGIRLENEMVKIAKQYDVCLLGPNCMGILNNVDKINILGMETVKDAFERKPDVAIVSHSGGLASLFMSRPGFPVGYLVSTGNGSVVALEELMEYLIEDQTIKVVAAYIEGIKKPHVFYRALKRAAEIRKPLVLLKAGRSTIGAASAASHTGNLAGSHKAFEALFEKYGVVVVHTLEEWICMSQMLATLDGNYPKVPGLASMNTAGGFGILSAEFAEEHGVSLPKPQDATREALKQYIPSFANPSNPLDFTTELIGDTERLVGILKAFDADPDIGAITITQDIQEVPTKIVGGMIEAFIEGRARGVTKPLFFNSLTERTRNIDLRKKLEDHGVVVLPSISVAYKCLKKLMDYAQYNAIEHDLIIPPPQGPHTSAYHTLSETDSKQALLQYGIPVPAQMIARSVRDIEQVQDIRFPWALKINSPDILHKSDAGCVKLNISNREEASRAFEQILENAKMQMLDARLDGVIVQEMARSGREMIVGISNDAQLGPMLLVGMGGIFVEVFQDAAMYPVPINKKEALDLLKKLKSYKLLEGYRGEPPCDIDALLDVMVKISWYAHEHRTEIREMDINPLFIYPRGEGVCAVDALIVKFQP